MYSGISTLLYTELESIAISLKALSMFSGDRSLEWILNSSIINKNIEFSSDVHGPCIIISDLSSVCKFLKIRNWNLMFMTFTAALALNYSSTKAIRAIFTFACISAGHFHFITSTATTVIIFIRTGSFFSIDTTSTVHLFNCFLLCFLQLWFWYHRIIMTSTHVIIGN